MEKTLKINPQHIDQFVSREMKRQLDILKIAFGCLLVLFIILGVISKAAFIPLIAVVVFGAVYLYVSAISKGDLKALSTAFTFTIDEYKISRQVDWSQLSAFMKIRATRASQKYGSTLEQEIAWGRIAEISADIHGIKISSVNANVLNGNGIINLPAELDAYEVVLDHFKSHPSFVRK